MSAHPKWKYHATQQAQIVDTADAESGLPSGWFDTPAEAKAAQEAIEASRLAEQARIDAEAEAELQRLANTPTKVLTDEEKAAAAADAENYRKELLEKAKELGLKPHHLTKAENLMALIAAKEEENAL